MNRMLFLAALLSLLVIATPYNAQGEDLAAASSLVHSNYGTPLGTLENLYPEAPSSTTHSPL